MYIRLVKKNKTLNKKKVPIDSLAVVRERMCARCEGARMGIIAAVHGVVAGSVFGGVMHSAVVGVRPISLRNAFSSGCVKSMCKKNMKVC